jgi:hypothetical protein
MQLTPTRGGLSSWARSIQADCRKIGAGGVGVRAVARPENEGARRARAALRQTWAWTGGQSRQNRPHASGCLFRARPQAGYGASIAEKSRPGAGSFKAGRQDMGRPSGGPRSDGQDNDQTAGGTVPPFQHQPGPGRAV